MPKLFIVLTTSFVEVRCAVKDQVAGPLVVRKGLAQLLRNPRTTWVPSDVEMKDSPSVMPDHKEAVEHTKGQCRHSKEVHRGNRFTMVIQECRPSLGWLRDPWRLPHPTRHSPLRDIEAKHLKLAMNARRSPRPVLGLCLAKMPSDREITSLNG
jgi:hypothetical protein